MARTMEVTGKVKLPFLKAWQSQAHKMLYGSQGRGPVGSLVDALSLPTESAKIGTLTYLSRHVLTVPD